MDANRGSQTQVTINAASDGAPAWSPNGARIIFHQLPKSGGGVQISSIRRDGTDQVRLTQSGDDSTDPDWQAKA